MAFSRPKATVTNYFSHTVYSLFIHISHIFFSYILILFSTLPTSVSHAGKA